MSDIRDAENNVDALIDGSDELLMNMCEICRRGKRLTDTQISAGGCMHFMHARCFIGWRNTQEEQGLEPTCAVCRGSAIDMRVPAVDEGKIEHHLLFSLRGFVPNADEQIDDAQVYIVNAPPGENRHQIQDMAEQPVPNQSPRQPEASVPERAVAQDTVDVGVQVEAEELRGVPQRFQQLGRLRQGIRRRQRRVLRPIPVSWMCKCGAGFLTKTGLVAHFRRHESIDHAELEYVQLD